MYYFFRPKIVYWKGNSISARFVSKNLGDLERVWWYGKPLQPIPLEFLFCIPARAPVLDNYYPGLVLDIYSAKLIEIFRNHGIHFELFPAKFIDCKTEKTLDMNHHVFRLLDISDCLDEEKTEYKTMMWVGDREVKMLTKPSFTDDFLRSGILLTRIRGNEKYVLIHESLKREIESAGISGCNFGTE